MFRFLRVVGSNRRTGAVRCFHAALPVKQVEAIGMIVDAAEMAKKDSHDKRSTRLRRSGARRGSGGGKKENGDNRNNEGNGFWSKNIKKTLIEAARAAIIMTSGFAMLGVAGMAYHRMYRHHMLNKMEYAFDSFDPVLEMSSGQNHTQVGTRILYKGEQQESERLKLPLSESTNPEKSAQAPSVGNGVSERNDDWIERPQQKLIDDIVSGKAGGRYFMLLGEKGSGKTSMLLHALQGVGGYNVVVVDAHADMEIFRQRLGKALNFEFYEDYWGGLFSLRGPRENTFLDIERVFNVLEQVSVRRYTRLKRPLVVVINSAHLIPEDQDGQKLLSLLQQKAESLSGSGVATMVFNSDDYWLYQRMSRVQTRMDAISIGDLHRPEAIRLLRSLRQRIRTNSKTWSNGGDVMVNDKLAETIYQLVGGRPQFLAAVAEHEDMVAAAQRLIDREKQWFLNKCALLGPDMDDDVMDSGKFSVAGMKLAREFVRLEREQNLQCEVPRMPLWRARQIMTRPDFIREYDNLNLFTLDSESRVKPDSIVMMHAFREIVSMPGFEELLEATDERVSEIESLHRTRELTLKDLSDDGDHCGTIILRPLKEESGLELSLGKRSKADTDNSNSKESQSNEEMMLDADEQYYWKRRLKRIDDLTKANIDKHN